jgi:hypothetical protein
LLRETGIIFFVPQNLKEETAYEKFLKITNKGGEVFFNVVTIKIYNFEIGYCEPIDRWLKYRKDDSIILNNEGLQRVKD